MASEYLWRGGAFVPLDRDRAAKLLAADSWRSEDGRAAAFGYHAARFQDAVARVSEDRFDWLGVWEALAEIVARQAEASLFPRISLEPIGLVLAIRPCMPVRATTTLTVLEGDPRSSPNIKGPDIARLAQAKSTARTDDVILTDGDGALLEASTGALVHWRGDVIVMSNRFERQLPSVTLRQVFDRARSLGMPVRFRPVFASELGSGPLWFLNAVHGVSPVPVVLSGRADIAIPQHPDEAEWRDWWWTTFESMPAPVASDASSRGHAHPCLRPFAEAGAHGG